VVEDLMDFPVILDKEDMALLLKECALAGYSLRTNEPQTRMLREHLGSAADRLAQGYDDIIIVHEATLLAEYWLLREKWCRPSSVDREARRWIFPTR
jgi:hypothetical protein